MGHNIKLYIYVCVCICAPLTPIIGSYITNIVCALPNYLANQMLQNLSVLCTVCAL